MGSDGEGARPGPAAGREGPAPTTTGDGTPTAAAGQRRPAGASEESEGPERPERRTDPAEAGPEGTTGDAGPTAPAGLDLPEATESAGGRRSPLPPEKAHGAACGGRPAVPGQRAAEDVPVLGRPPVPPDEGSAVPGEVDVQVSALSAPARAVAVAVACVVALTVVVHLAMVFLHVAPANTVSKQHSQAVYDYVYPEYEQNWKLFAPNPVQQNIDVEVRARVRPQPGGADGGTTVTAWTDLTAQDGAAIHHNPFPSHASQNELRRAWEVFLGSHNAQNQPTGRRGVMSERFLRRLAMLRMSDQWVRQGRIEQVQFRSKSVAVPPPPWSSERIDLKPVYREVPWWNIRADDLPEGATNK